MSFVAAVDHLHALGHELSAPGAPHRKFELEHMRTLARALGSPERCFPAILIAGTNGKGSTAATLASILAAAGYRTGLYTSPHLEQVTERIRVAGGRVQGSGDSSPANASSLNPDPFTLISEADFARLYFRVDDCARALVSRGELPHHPSFFEALTALAFLSFADREADGGTGHPVDIAVLEVGMGGRLDATNIVEPVLSIITDIALDHQEYLGPTIAAIAREKAGILRPGGTLITLPQHPEANQSIGEAAVALEVRAINAAAYLPDVVHSPSSKSWGSPDSNAACMTQSSRGVVGVLPANEYDLRVDGGTLHVRSPLPGEHQRRNLALAIAAALELRNQHGYKIENAALEAGIANTRWPGRLEFLPPDLLLDVAHNPAGAWTLRAALATLPESQPRTLIFSCLRDKDLDEMAQILFPLFDATGGRPQDHIVFAPIANPRAASLESLLAAADRLSVPAQAAESPAAALTLARSLTPGGGLIVATGSIYLIGALREAVPTQ